MDPSTLNSPAVQGRLQQIQSSPLLQTLFAPYLSPGVQLGQTQAEIPQIQASTANTQAQLPGVQATSSIDQIKALQTQASISLGNDIQKGMTWDDARKKYTSLGLSADDVFKSYLANSPYGVPNESPAKLQAQGVQAQTLGQIGTPGSFMDKYNTKNAIQGLRTLEGLWNETTPTERALGLGKNVQAYDAARQVFGEHLSSLIPGASGAQATGQALINTIPSSSDLKSDVQGAAGAKFQAVEDQLLQTKGYDSKTLGLSPRSSNQQSAPTNNIDNALTDMLSGKPISAGQDVMKQIIGVAPNANAQQISKATNSSLQDNANSFNTSLATGALGGIFSGGATAAGESSTTAGLPGALKTFLNPGRAIAQAGNVRNAVVQTASQAGKTINGDAIISGLEDWAKTAKMGNLGQGGAIDQALADAKSIFQGAKLIPQDIMQAYQEADSGFTKTGIPKSPIQSNIDRGVRDVLAKELDKVAPGWKDATTSMAKGFQADKSVIRQGGKNLVKYGLTLGVPTAAADALTHVLFGR